MQNIDGEEHNQEKSHLINSGEITDRRILLSFYIGLVIAFVLTIPVVFILGMAQLSVIITVLIMNIIGAFFLTGLLSFKYNSKKGIIPTRKIIKSLMKVSAISAPF